MKINRVIQDQTTKIPHNFNLKLITDIFYFRSRAGTDYTNVRR